MNVVWSPSPNWNQRDARYPLKGDVSHRIVGSAPSALALFSRAGTASSHFVIGHTQVGDPCPRCGPITGARGPLQVWQCVDLALMAWTNGDVRDPTWPGYQPGVNPNLTTITTEHEDMGAAGRHIVTAHVWEASCELKKLLRSGDLQAIRAAGIRAGDGAFAASALVARMGALPISAATYIDHHAIAGPNKPWCWRDFDGDTGFPSRLPGLLTYLALPGGDMPLPLIEEYEKFTTKVGGTFYTDGWQVGPAKQWTSAVVLEAIAKSPPNANGYSSVRLMRYQNDPTAKREVLYADRAGLTPVTPSTRKEALPFGAADCSVQDAKLTEARLGVAALRGQHTEEGAALEGVARALGT